MSRDSRRELASSDGAGRQQWHSANELNLTASQLVSEIAALMELNWMLEDQGSYIAPFRKEQKR